MAFGKDLWNDFDAYFPTILKDLSTVNDDDQISCSYRRVKEILEYNVPHGKRTRGLTVVSSYISLKNCNLSCEENNIAMTLGWAVEILQAALLVADDIMDQSMTRRGKLCWYRNKDVGNQALNDSLLLESCVFTLLRKNCRKMSCYADLFDLFHKVLLKTELGQSLDMATSEKPEVDFSLFTEERYFAIVKYKTAYYSFYLPVAVALYLAGISDMQLHKKVCDILTNMGNLFQVQDDYLDIFGDPAITGKIGTDIEDNKCSWLIVKAIERASPNQRAALEMNYGKRDQSKVKVVKEIFQELDISSVYTKFESDFYEKILAEINAFDDQSVPKSIFLNLLNKIYKRVK